jgi:hypothetical protein
MDSAGGSTSGVLAEQAPAAAAKAPVHGLYRGSAGASSCDLRVDVDGPRATNRLSADFYSSSGATLTYVGSLRVDVPQVTWTDELVTIAGTGTFTFHTEAPKVKVTIPRVDAGAPSASATLEFFANAGRPGAVYVCTFASSHFRTVLLEEDVQDGVTPFHSYNTGSLPSGGPARDLTVISAYAEAGIEIQSTGQSNVISAAGNAAWSDAELHAAMQANFSRFVDAPQWASWLMHARLHDKGPGLYGLMFDQRGRQRQGSAVFYESLAGSSADRQRLQLFTCVHEFGHGFNLLHSWQKSLGRPPAPNRPAALSWMNYPWNFRGGPAAFWSAFAFQFDDQEIVHLRHAFREGIVMGGNPFAAGSALGHDAGWGDPERDESGLRLSLVAPRSVPYGVPVTVDLALHGTTERGRVVPNVLGPRPGSVDIVIRQPGGSSVVFAPLLLHCRGDDGRQRLRAGDEPVRDSAFIHYGEDGFVFDQPGRYTLKARYAADDGSSVLSELATLLVQTPVSEADNEVAELAFGEEQGILMSVLGSDDPSLRSGNDALMEIIERHPGHAAAAAARVVLGTNAAREFKAVQHDGSVSVRSPQTEDAVRLLGDVFDLDTVRSAASGADDAEAARQAAAMEMPKVGTHDEIPVAIDVFIRSRLDEIAIEVPELL